jgi:hypothetical protein
VPEILVAAGVVKAEETNCGSGVELASGAVGRDLGRGFALLVVAGCGGVVGAGLAEEQAEVVGFVAGPAAPGKSAWCKMLTCAPT